MNIEVLKKLEGALPTSNGNVALSPVDMFEIRTGSRCATAIRSAIRNFKRDSAIHAIASGNAEAAMELATDYINSLVRR